MRACDCVCACEEVRVGACGGVCVHVKVCVCVCEEQK